MAELIVTIGAISGILTISEFSTHGMKHIRREIKAYNGRHEWWSSVHTSVEEYLIIIGWLIDFVVARDKANDKPPSTDAHCEKMLRRCYDLCERIKKVHSEWIADDREGNRFERFWNNLRGKSPVEDILKELESAKVQMLVYSQISLLDLGDRQRRDISSVREDMIKVLSGIESLQEAAIQHSSLSNEPHYSHQKRERNAPVSLGSIRRRATRDTRKSRIRNPNRTTSTRSPSGLERRASFAPQTRPQSQCDMNGSELSDDAAKDQSIAMVQDTAGYMIGGSLTDGPVASISTDGITANEVQECPDSDDRTSNDCASTSVDLPIPNTREVPKSDIVTPEAYPNDDPRGALSFTENILSRESVPDLYFNLSDEYQHDPRSSLLLAKALSSASESDDHLPDESSDIPSPSIFDNSSLARHSVHNVSQTEFEPSISEQQLYEATDKVSRDRPRTQINAQAGISSQHQRFHESVHLYDWESSSVVIGATKSDEGCDSEVEGLNKPAHVEDTWRFHERSHDLFHSILVHADDKIPRRVSEDIFVDIVLLSAVSQRDSETLSSVAKYAGPWITRFPTFFEPAPYHMEVSLFVCWALGLADDFKAQTAIIWKQATSYLERLPCPISEALEQKRTAAQALYRDAVKYLVSDYAKENQEIRSLSGALVDDMMGHFLSQCTKLGFLIRKSHQCEIDDEGEQVSFDELRRNIESIEDLDNYFISAQSPLASAAQLVTSVLGSALPIPRPPTAPRHAVYLDNSVRTDLQAIIDGIGQGDCGLDLDQFRDVTLDADMLCRIQSLLFAMYPHKRRNMEKCADVMTTSQTGD